MFYKNININKKILIYSQKRSVSFLFKFFSLKVMPIKQHIWNCHEASFFHNVYQSFYPKNWLNNSEVWNIQQELCRLRFNNNALQDDLYEYSAMSEINRHVLMGVDSDLYHQSLNNAQLLSTQNALVLAALNILVFISTLSVENHNVLTYETITLEMLDVIKISLKIIGNLVPPDLTPTVDNFNNTIVRLEDFKILEDIKRNS